jgi:hypothetical protein
MLIVDVCPPELWGHVFLLFKPLSLQYFVMAALGDKHIYISDELKKKKKKGHIQSHDQAEWELQIFVNSQN